MDIYTMAWIVPNGIPSQDQQTAVRRSLPHHGHCAVRLAASRRNRAPIVAEGGVSDIGEAVINEQAAAIFKNDMVENAAAHVFVAQFGADEAFSSGGIRQQGELTKSIGKRSRRQRANAI